MKMIIPRWVIYLLIFVGVLVPLFTPTTLKVKVEHPTRSLFDYIDSMPESKALMISIDFDPQSSPELYPMLVALLRHAFHKNIKVILMGMWQTGLGMGDEALRTVSKEYDKEYGEDYAYLGWVYPWVPTILKMGESITEAFPKDYYGKKTSELPIFKNIKNYSNIGLIVSLAAGSPGYEMYVVYANTTYGVKIGTGVTGVGGADVYPYLQTGQLIGSLAGMVGAAEYERLCVEHGYFKKELPVYVTQRASQAMLSQSVAHILIMIFIIIGNIEFFLLRKRRK